MNDIIVLQIINKSTGGYVKTDPFRPEQNRQSGSDVGVGGRNSIPDVSFSKAR